MDPISISASIAGLLTLAAATAATLDALFRDFKSRPAVLLSISQEIEALRFVLEELEGQTHSPSSTGKKEDEKPLRAVIDLCMRTFQQIGSQICKLQSRLRKGSLSKAYTFMSYPSRLKEISALRDDLQKYKVTLLIALQMHKPMEDSASLEALRQDIVHLRSTMLEVRQSSITADLERMDVIKDYIEASSTTLFGKDVTKSFPTTTIAGDISNSQGHASGLIGCAAIDPAGGTSDLPTCGSDDWLDDNWLSPFVPDPDIQDRDEDERLAAFRIRNRENTHSVSERTTPIAVEVPSPAEMIPSSDALSLISQHLPIRRDIPDGQIHLIFVNLRKHGSDKTFTEDLITSPEIPVYKVIHELHQKGYTRTCGFQSVDRQSTYSPMVSHDSFLPVVVTAGSPTYDIPSGLQINIDERLIDFFNRFILADPGTPARDLLSVKRSKAAVRIRDSRSNSVDILFQRTLRLPEDGKPYLLPAYIGLYPLLDVETFSDRLPVHMRRKGGLLIPMFQREALSLHFGSRNNVSDERFAIRVYAGSINAISGKAAQRQSSEGEQDYIVVPKQRRLDGFHAGKGMVKQFVAMPLGFGYSVEKQVTGTEFIGGIQLEIIPRLSDEVIFIRPGLNTTLSGLPQQLQTSEDLFQTPRELGMAAGQLLLMQDRMAPLKSKRVKFDLRFLTDNNGSSHVSWFEDDNSSQQDFLPVYEQMCRPTFVHEMFLGTRQHTHIHSMNESLVLHPVEPLSLRVDWQSMRSSKGTTIEEYSPFLHVSDLKRCISSNTDKRSGHFLFNGTVHKEYPTKYFPLADFFPEGGNISFKEDLSAKNEHYGWTHSCPLLPFSSAMSLGAGKNLGQGIEKTTDGRLWDWGTARLINIQILNTVAFKEFTGVAPVTPISFREYVKAKIPFYSFPYVSEDSIIGDQPPTFRSIGQLDRSAVVQIGIRVNRSGKPVGCSNCEQNICDTILQPCKHIFCSDCFKLTMVSDSLITCIFCGITVSEAIAFSAPMEMPSSAPEEQPGIKCIAPEDGIREIPRSPVTQQGELKSPKNILQNIMWLYRRR